MNSILQKIINEKKAGLEVQKKAVSLQSIKAQTANLEPRRGFKKALERKDRINIIAEIKQATPALGIISKDFKPAFLAKEYTLGGASAISVLTEEKFFLGDLSHLSVVRENTSLPVLRKDFIFAPYQIYESLIAGADAILLITSILEQPLLKELIALTKKLKLDCLVEVHDEKDLEKALSVEAEIIGINSRDLDTFEIDLESAKKLYAKIPGGKVVVLESGIKTPEEIKAFSDIGIKNFLVGNTLMTSKDIRKTLKDLKGVQ